MATMDSTLESPNPAGESLREQVRSAVIWRSGSQIAGQLITWTFTFLVIRILSPSDYGLYAMTAVVLNFLSLVNGSGLANALIQKRDATPDMLRQLFGMLILLNGALAAIQFAAAPFIADYYGQPVVGDMLRLQTLIYLANPFLALAYAVLSRRMDFRRQAQVNLVSALAGAAAALAGAAAGLGVWALVYSPLVLFGLRALAMTVAAGTFVRPSFDFRGTWSLARFGGLVVAAQFFWCVQAQADVIFAGRAFDPHGLGLYTTALFLTQMFVTKFVPPINEVAFAAYARIQDDRSAAGFGFLKSVRIIMLAGIPFSLGLAASADALVPVLLGEKWQAAAPVVFHLGLAMPFMTLQVLFGPAVSAMGRPGLTTLTSLMGAILLPLAYLGGIAWGPVGLAASWLAGYPLLVALSAALVLPAIGVSARQLAVAVAPTALAGLAMLLAVRALDGALPDIPPIARLAALVAAGALVYFAALMLFARQRLEEVIDLMRRRARSPA
jgi:O-antigen/teichoic acid export membrane protein